MGNASKVRALKRNIQEEIGFEYIGAASEGVFETLCSKIILPQDDVVSVNQLPLCQVSQVTGVTDNSDAVELAFKLFAESSPMANIKRPLLNGEPLRFYKTE